MMKKKITISSVVFLLCLFFACSIDQSKKITDVEMLKEDTQIDQNKKDTIEDFNTFYKRFFLDSVFQISRIAFPLEGTDSKYIYGDTVVPDQENDTVIIKANKLYWKAKGWVFLKKSQKTKEFKEVIERKSSKVIVKFFLEDTDYVVVLIFRNNNGKWMLKYYSSEWY